MHNPTIRRLYLYSFFDDFILIYPLYQLMFVARGLSVGQISLLFVIWAAVSLAAEIPTGLLADRYSRKNLLAVGQLIRAAGYGLWLIAPTFWGFAGGFALWGIGGAFSSGTFQALLYDELEVAGEQAHYVRIYGRAQSWMLTGDLVATVAAAGAVGFGYTIIVVASVAAVIVAAGVAWSIPEAPKRELIREEHYLRAVRDGLVVAAHNGMVLRVALLAAFLAAIYGSLEEYTPLYFRSAGAPLALVPILVGVLVLVSLVASIAAHRFERLGTTAFMGILGISGAALVGAGVLVGVAGLGLMMVFFFTIKVLEVIFGGQLQHNISGKLRATTTSVAEFMTGVLSIGVYLAFGAVAARYGTLSAFAVIGAGVVVVAAAYLTRSRQLFG
jgi:MFS family permease